MKLNELEKTHFYENLKILIKNMKQFSEKNNIKYNTLQNTIYQINKPSIDVVILISKGLNISIDDLLYKDFTKEQKQNEN